MGWLILATLIFFLGLVAIVLLGRRSELQRMAVLLADLGEAKKTGSHRARLQYRALTLASVSAAEHALTPARKTACWI